MFNLSDNTQYQIDTPYDKLIEIINYIHTHRYIIPTISDEEFIAQCHSIQSRYNSIKPPCFNYISKYSDHKILIDIETDGISKIIQVSYIVLDQSNNIIDSKDIIIDDKSNSVDFYNKITLGYKKKHGLGYIQAITIIYNDLLKSSEIIGHNIIAFDMKYLTRYFTNCGLTLPPNKIIYDTQKVSCPILKLKNKLGRQKMPSLKELCEYFGYKPDPEKQHNANYDIELTYKCYYKLKSLT